MNSSTGGTGGLGDAGTSGFGGAGSTGGTGSTGGYGAGTTGSTSGAGSSFGATGGTLADDTASTSTGRMQSAKDAAADKFGQLKDKAANLNLREKASNLNASLADKLEAGANKLRQPAPGTATGDLTGTAGLTGSGTLGTSDNAQLANLGNKAADALQGTARFLREGDLKASVEEQVRTNPARTLLVALGVGYVLGKAFRGGNRS